jgi:putative ABC transport system ATP-binding protein
MTSDAPNAVSTGPGDLTFEARALTKVYRTAAGEVRALRGVDLDIRQGETLVLLGPSGSGKSTLLNILGGLDRATDGQLLFHGRDLARASDSALTDYRRQSVGFIFQFFNLSPSLTARENVELVTDIADHPMEARHALALVGLEDRLDHFPAELSGGQQQRVAVARAIAKRPAILFCDEPTGSLDSESGVQVLDAIVDVAGEIGATTMIVTHNAVVAGIADRIIHFSNGAILQLEQNRAKRAPHQLSW